MTDQYEHPKRRKGISDADCIKIFGQETYLQIMYNSGIQIDSEAIDEARRRQRSWRNNFN